MSTYGDYQRRYYQEHRKKILDYYKAQRDERKANHLCVRCGGQDEYTLKGRTLCRECCAKERERQIKRGMKP